MAMSCSNGVYPEGVIIKTKHYVGQYITSHSYKGYTCIETSQGIFTIKDSLSVPENTPCYVRIKLHRYDIHPDLKWQLEPQYLSFNNIEGEFRLLDNVRLY